MELYGRRGWEVYRLLEKVGCTPSAVAAVAMARKEGKVGWVGGVLAGNAFAYRRALERLWGLWYPVDACRRFCRYGGVGGVFLEGCCEGWRNCWEGEEEVEGADEERGRGRNCWTADGDALTRGSSSLLLEDTPAFYTPRMNSSSGSSARSASSGYSSSYAGFPDEEGTMGPQRSRRVRSRSLPPVFS